MFTLNIVKSFAFHVAFDLSYTGLINFGTFEVNHWFPLLQFGANVLSIRLGIYLLTYSNLYLILVSKLLVLLGCDIWYNRDTNIHSDGYHRYAYLSIIIMRSYFMILFRFVDLFRSHRFHIFFPRRFTGSTVQLYQFEIKHL